MIRIGMGYDVHPLVAGYPCVLGGIEIPHEKGLKGHSDGDALLHALCDALLGAAALGDIGRHFAPGDPRWKGIASLKLLILVVEMLRKKGYQILNCDCTVIAEAPRIAPFIEAMIFKISPVLGIDPREINIKGTTNEKIGFIGRGEGIAAQAVCLISGDSDKS